MGGGLFGVVWRRLVLLDRGIELFGAAVARIGLFGKKKSEKPPLNPTKREPPEPLTSCLLGF